MRTTLTIVMIAFLCMSLLGCKNDGGGDNNTNPDTDIDSGDTGDCPEGDLDCPCYVNNTCNMLDGEPLACMDGLCVVVDEPDPGELNGACAVDDDCGDHMGNPLRCISEICQLPDCLSGTTNCPCGPAGTCDMEGAACMDDTCRLEECDPGTAGCECDMGSCIGDLECTMGLCELGVGAHIAVGDEDARACEVVLHDPRDLVTTITFADTLRGQYEARGDRVAIAFHAESDAAIADGAVELTFGTANTDELSSVTVMVGECFNINGAVISGVSPTIAQ